MLDTGARSGSCGEVLMPVMKKRMLDVFVTLSEKRQKALIEIAKDMHKVDMLSKKGGELIEGGICKIVRLKKRGVYEGSNLYPEKSRG
jgi:hypothetical protein